MRTRLTMAACGLAAAGALAAGQPPAEPLVPVPVPAPAIAISPEAARSAEVAVELAWLSDAATFPYPLTARFKDGAIELRGHVPSAGIKAKALALAKESNAWPVVDRLAVQSNMALTLPTPPDADFAEEAKARFFSVGRLEGKQIELKTTKDGKLFVAGCAASLEEKLAYSKAFRGLAGCRLVRNELVVGPPPVATVAHEDPPKPAEPSPFREPILGAPKKREMPRLQPPIKANGNRSQESGVRGQEPDRTNGVF